MGQSKFGVDEEVHRKLAAGLFNFTWDLIDKEDRDNTENEIMVNAAHASTFHWTIVGTSLQIARGEWLISRTYALTGRSEPALFHAKKTLEMCLDENLGNFDLGFAYEAMARSFGVQGNPDKSSEFLDRATTTAEKVEKEQDREWLMSNIDSVRTLSLPDWND